MDERKGMHHFQRTRRRHRLFLCAAKNPAEFQHQHRTNPLAACLQRIPHGIYYLRLALCLRRHLYIAEQLCFHLCRQLFQMGFILRFHLFPPVLPRLSLQAEDTGGTLLVLPQRPCR